MSFFINLESLFEDAVRETVRSSVKPLEVVKGREYATPLFNDLEDRYLADPDMVVMKDGEPILVADTKYKDLAGYPGHSDVYQLVSHTEAFGAKRACLVYPGEVPSVTRLGQTSSGIVLWWAKVRPANLSTDTGTVFSYINLYS